MIRKITIATISVLLAASVLFTIISPLIPTALDIYFKDQDKMMSQLLLFGVIISFAFATILILICVFWKEKKEEQLNESNNDKR